MYFVHLYTCNLCLLSLFSFLLLHHQLLPLSTRSFFWFHCYFSSLPLSLALCLLATAHQGTVPFRSTVVTRKRPPNGSVLDGSFSCERQALSREATETLAAAAAAAAAETRHTSEKRIARTLLLILYMFARHAKRHKSFFEDERGKRVQDKVKKERMGWTHSASVSVCECVSEGRERARAREKERSNRVP